MTVETRKNEDFPLLEKVHEGYVPDPNYSRAIAMEIGKVQRNRGLKPSEKAKEIHRLKRMQMEIRRARAN